MIRAMLATLLLALSLPLSADSWQNPAMLKELALAFARQQTLALPGQVSISAGALDDSLRLAGCPKPEAWLPPGNRLWGNTTVGMRCLNPAWNVYIPITVKVTGQVVVVTRPLAQGHILTGSDLTLQTTELTQQPAGILSSPDQAVGKTLTTSVGSGLALRTDMLRAATVIKQGQTVKLQVRGQGFSVSSEGKALANAAEGQIVPVKTPSGQTVKGVAKTGNVVEISY
jgi:flagella basal body P-ring formation protein FlgA